ncbi:MAG: hypothetical protein MUF40_01365 [Gemmatimonadaceae bacterium]|jgi:hypothetical protein|nr:hypothetical protein [Gemmatimonadaceae bacterium]
MTTAAHTLHTVRRTLVRALGDVAHGGSTDHVLDLARDVPPASRRAAVRPLVGPATVAIPTPTCATFEGFLDGVQRHAVVAHVRGAPVLVGTVAAAIRERVDGRMRTWGTPRIVHAVYAPGDWFDAPLVAQLRAALEPAGIPLVTVDEDRASDAPRHPAAIAGAALVRLARERDALERTCALDWSAAHDARPLYVDGTLGRGTRRLEAPGMVGVVKSHGTLYVADDAGAERVFALAAGERTAVSLVLDGEAPSGIATWYLRLRDAAGRDPFFGLVRVECAVRALDDAALAAHADAVSGWLLAERAPLATPHAQWDVLPYAARDVSRWLAAVA